MSLIWRTGFNGNPGKVIFRKSEGFRWTITCTHPEARSWQSRVDSNGGSVSASTMQAVSRFCFDIDATPGLRSAIIRLNPFCGDQLAAALTPLYLSTSSGGATVGNATDTNFNFVASDYTSAGLKGNGVDKYLATGVPPAATLSTVSSSFSLSATNLETTGDFVALGSYQGASVSLQSLDISTEYVAARTYRSGSFTAGQFPVTTRLSVEDHILGTRTASNEATIYRNGTAVASNSYGLFPNLNPLGIYIFSLNFNNSPVGFTAARFRLYHIGNGINATQAAAFAAAVADLNTALGR